MIKHFNASHTFLYDPTEIVVVSQQRIFYFQQPDSD